MAIFLILISIFIVLKRFSGCMSPLSSQVDVFINGLSRSAWNLRSEYEPTPSSQFIRIGVNLFRDVCNGRTSSRTFPVEYNGTICLIYAGL